jgi:predicted dehydrogenase
MIEQERPEAVYAIMPPHHLYDMAATVIEMGCNLFIEKPPAVTTEQTRQLALLARKHKVLTGVTFQRRFAPLIRRGLARCAEKGPIHTAHACFYKNTAGAGPYYRGAMDILTCDGIHAVDTLRFLCGGEVESVASDSRRLDAEHWNLHLALIKFSSGATGLLLVNFMTGRRMFAAEVHGAGISFFGDPEEGGRVFADGRLEPVEVLDPFELSGSRESYRAFGAYDTNLHFIQCVQQGKEPETNFADAVKTMELVDAIYQSQI